jgi:alkaline phosphatase D
MTEDRREGNRLTTRREMLAALSGLTALAGCTTLTARGSTQYGFDNGLKVGAVTADSALLWTRLSKVATGEEANRKRWYPSATGTVELLVWPEGGLEEGWRVQQPATDEQDGTVQFRLTDLEPATEYHLLLAGRPAEGDEIAKLIGSFRTAPDATTAEPISFAVVSCQAWRFRDAGGSGFRTRDADLTGFQTYDTLLDMEPSFFVHTGDMVYYDQGELRGRSVSKARTHWHRTYSLELLREFHSRTPSYFLKDDHDIIDNDSWPGQRYGNLTFEEGVSVFKEQNPTGDRPYRTVRWGEDLQIWLLEMREFRSPNTMPDGPEKTILGEQQLQWFQETIEASDAAFRVVIAPSIFVGPDRGSKSDNYANEGFSAEGEMLREFLAERNVIVVGGDRHWQYVSVDQETGLWEFGCGALAEGREGGWRTGDIRPEHRFLAVEPGFVWATVDREEGEPVLTIDHRSRHGERRHREQFTANPVEHRADRERTE